jgi:dTDP-4-dehydrorhamnose reductase
MKVVVLGASGMLGSMVADVLSRHGEFDLTCTVRTQEALDRGRAVVPPATWLLLDAERPDREGLCKIVQGASWIVNAIGVIKPYIHDDNATEVERAVLVNALFPHLLATVASDSGGRVLQIATDCVYSGRKGAYVESDAHDALDVYGKSKSLGEVTSESVGHLRCSIIGPEYKAHLSLLDWFRRQPKGASVGGYVNHHWNGVSTYHFARLCHGVITNGVKVRQLQHIVPSSAIAKYDLLRAFARSFGRGDITINPTNANVVVDRTLATARTDDNLACWKAAGYATPPSVEQMVEELAAFDYRFAELVTRL